jgi:hypothetical protein
MQHTRLVKALTKAGATVSNVPAWNGKESRTWSAKGDKTTIYWYTQDSMDGTVDAICVHEKSPHTDIQTDMFCDTYFYTIRSAVASLC